MEGQRKRREKGKSGEKIRRGHGTTLLERGRIRRGLAVGSRTDLESAHYAPSLLEFLGPLLAPSAVSPDDHLRAGPAGRAAGPRSLRAAPPLSANRGDSPHPWGSSMCTGGEHTGSFRSLSFPPRLLASSPRSHHDLSLFLPSTPFFLFALKTSDRTTAPRAHISRSILLLSREHTDGIKYGPVLPLRGKGPYFSTRLSSPSSSLSSFFSISSYFFIACRRDGPATSD